MVYSRPDAPVCAALEMRLTGGSDALLAAQRGDTSTLSIEVFTIPSTPPDDWRTSRQQIVNHWTSCTSPSTGEYINARPHSAKQWWDLEVRGKPIEEYLKEDAYKTVLAEFHDAMEGIVTKRGGTVGEIERLIDLELGSKPALRVVLRRTCSYALHYDSLTTLG
jgi:hypothetical protein